MCRSLSLSLSLFTIITVVFLRSCPPFQLCSHSDTDMVGYTYQVGLIECGGHVGSNESGTDSVHSNVPGGKFLGIAHGEAKNTSLGSSVVGLAGVSDLSDDTGDVDDTAGTLLGGNLEEGLCAVKDSGQVGVNHILPLSRLHASDESVTSDSGVVDEHIDRSELFNNGVKHRLDGVRIGTCTSSKFRQS